MYKNILDIYASVFRFLSLLTFLSLFLNWNSEVLKKTTGSAVKEKKSYYDKTARKVCSLVILAEFVSKTRACSSQCACVHVHSEYRICHQGQSCHVTFHLLSFCHFLI